MNRRHVLRLAVGAGVAGTSVGAGCLGFDDDRPAVSNSEDDSSGTACQSEADDGLPAERSIPYAWVYPVGGELDAVLDGTVFARERSSRRQPCESAEDGPNADGQVVALEAATGDLEWAYGGTGSGGTYTNLQIDDGAYFGYCSDDDCIGLYALELDGEERWTESTGVPRRGPHVANGAVYTVIDNGYARAFDADAGTKEWERPVEGHDGGRDGRWSLVDATDAVFLESDGSLLALDPVDGETRWRYDPGADRERIAATAVVDGVAYVVTDATVAAVDDGEVLWRREFDPGDVGHRREIVGVASSRLFAFVGLDAHEFRLFAFDVASGDREWESDSVSRPSEDVRPQAVVRDGVAYVGAQRLRALEAATGDERWNVDLEGGAVWGMTPVDAGAAGSESVIAQAGANRLVELDASGERVWSGSVEGQIRNYLVEEDVYVATDDGIYALERGPDE